MSRAFVSGSQVYGTPNNSSDVDLVILTDFASMEKLAPLASRVDTGSAEGSVDASLTFGRLNLICVGEPLDWAWWREGTDELRRSRPVFRQHAIDLLEIKKEAALNSVVAAVNQISRQVYRGGRAVADIKLFDLVRVQNTKHLWPADFTDKVKQLETDPDDKGRYGVVADWLDENREPELAEAFRYVFKRPNVFVQQARHTKSASWDLSGLPPAVSAHFGLFGFCVDTVPGLMAALAAALAKARADLV